MAIDKKYIKNTIKFEYKNSIKKQQNKYLNFSKDIIQNFATPQCERLLFR